MADFIATYDLKTDAVGAHWTFLEKAEARGWAVWIQAGDGKWYRLPNTTLIGSFDNKDAAVAALKATLADTVAAEKKPVSMPKWIVAGRGNSTFNSDETQ